ncbi:MAG: hypothetical protein ABIU05_18085 [Nitrospirales bacterium]
MDDAGVAVESLSEAAEALRADGQTVMFGTVDGKIAGLIGVADPIKPTTEKLSANCARRIFASSC